MFSLVSGLSSTTSAGGLPPLFGCFVGTTPLYDSPGASARAAVHEGLTAHRVLPPARRLLPAGGNGVSRFLRMEFLYMPGVFDSAGPRRTRVVVRHVVAFLTV